MRLIRAFCCRKKHRIVSTAVLLWIFSVMFAKRSIAFDATHRCLHRFRRAYEPKTFYRFRYLMKCTSYDFKIFGTFRTEKTIDTVEPEAINYSDILCNDDLSVRAMSSFGGIKYINTDVDSRFRVLFVLGGPGELY